MRMIQPINALTPQARFRGTHESRAKKSSGLNDSQIAVLNAGGIAAGAGGLTTLIARSYTNSFAHAGVLGVFGAFLTLFFMTPHLIEQVGLKKNVKTAQIVNVVKQDTPKAKSSVKEFIVPIKKLVQFKSEQA